MTASKDHLVSGLIEKRRELAGIIDHLQRQLDQYRVDLAHIDGALRLLAEGIDPTTIRPKRPYKRADYFGHNASPSLYPARVTEARVHLRQGIWHGSALENPTRYPL